MRNALSFIGRLLALRLLCSYRDSELEKVISPTGSRQVHRVWELRQGTHRAASEGLVELPQRDSVSLSIVLSFFLARLTLFSLLATGSYPDKCEPGLVNCCTYYVNTHVIGRSCADKSQGGRSLPI